MLKDFTALLEFRVGARCNWFEPDVLGGMARCYLCASSLEDAQLKIEAHLEAADVMLIEYEWIAEAEDMDLGDSSAEAAKLFAQARQSGEVQWERFDVWGDDAPDVSIS